MTGITVNDIHWLAGFLDGEGYFGTRRSNIVMSVSQKDEWHIRKVQSLIGGKVYHRPDNQGRWYWRMDMTGKAAAGLMMTLYTLMSPRRQERIEQCIAHWKSLGEAQNHWAKQTHCRAGHEYTEENTYRKPKTPEFRQCRTCMRGYQERYQRSKASKISSTL